MGSSQLRRRARRAPSIARRLGAHRGARPTCRRSGGSSTIRATGRRDYVENSNDSYWLANPSHPLTGFSPIIGQTGIAQDLRTRIGNQMIAARVAGTDGLGPAKFTIGTLQRMWEGDKSELAVLVLKQLVSDCQAHPMQVASDGKPINLTSACSALASYNGTGLMNAAGG